MCTPTRWLNLFANPRLITHLVLYLLRQKPRAKIFHFESYWLLHPGFMEVVKKVWDRPVCSDNAATILCRKFKLLRQELKAWSKNISRLSIAIENTNKALFDLDAPATMNSYIVEHASFCMNILMMTIISLLHTLVTSFTMKTFHSCVLMKPKTSLSAYYY